MPDDIPQYMPSYAQPMGYNGQAAAPAGAIDPATAKKILALQTVGPAQKLAERQMAMADMMRNQSSELLKGQQHGRMYRAPGWLNTAIASGGGLMSALMNQKAEEQMKLAGEQNAAGAGDMYDQLRKAAQLGQ